MPSKLEKLKTELEEAKGLRSAAVEADEKSFMDSEVERIEKEIKEEEAAASTSSGSGSAPTPAEKPKKEKKKKEPAKKKEKAKAEPKAKKKHSTKTTAKVGDKNLDDITCEELLEAYHARRAASKKAARKHKTQSIISKIAAGLASVGASAIKGVPKADIKDDPAAASKAFAKVGDIIDKAFRDIKEALKPVLESSDMKLSAEAKKDLESIDKLAAEMRKKYQD